ncbi:hypothetical protein HAHE_40940 [Haloferula helveola]|uniref:Protein kinase domain-containing protein n=1 Tax=Haloferula helveola TaxID=490095 RepID=A0ABM7RI52_9BACT|nr:hypothetical protein HAHE_40940 [Haloferula helveola]
MSKGEAEIAYCHACGGAMDVSAVEPFSNVECPNCGKHTRVKREFGPYTLLRRHAIGGMSLVFTAQDNTLDREVVVKILNKEYSEDEKRITAFEEEARITASISHPNVVRVFTTGRAFGRFFIAMEFVPGGHFEHQVRERGTIPEGEALPFAIEVIEGLKAAHQSGLIHRDVKPGNILIDGSGSAKIVDFGLALVTKGGKATASEIWATPYYVPPETIEGQSEDFRSDMYAFGATFYHALAGKPPCNEESMDTKRLRQAKLEVKPLAKVASWLDPATCEVIDRCMAYDPKGRFRTYEDLIAAMRDAQQMVRQRPPAPQKTAVPVPSLQSKKRSGGAKAGIALAWLAVLVAVGVAAKVIFGSGSKPPGGAGGGADDTVNPGPIAVGGSNAGAGVARTYREAGEALSAHDFATAAKKFAEVRDNPGVLEPTGSWAACEVVVMNYLDGRSGDADREIVRAIAHIEKARGLNRQLRDRLLEALGDLRRFPPIAPDESKGRGGADELVAILGGLKNWEQGTLGAAEPLLRKVAESSTGGGNAWLKPYADLAKDYLSDLGTLRRNEPKRFNLGASGCRERIEELKNVEGSLKTKGRARFNVGVWIKEFEKAVHLPPPPPPPGSLPKELKDLLAGCRFVEAVDVLRAWEPHEPKLVEQRSALMLLCQSAATFVSELGELAGPEVGKVSIRSRTGRKFERVVGGGDEGLRVADSAGSEADLRWGELDPNSLIDLHRGLVKDSVNDLDKFRRHEQAVAFDFLAGDPERAKAAGDRLAGYSEAFRRRWQKVAPAVRP